MKFTNWKNIIKGLFYPPAKELAKKYEEEKQSLKQKYTKRFISTIDEKSFIVSALDSTIEDLQQEREEEAQELKEAQTLLKELK